MDRDVGRRAHSFAPLPPSRIQRFMWAQSLAEITRDSLLNVWIGILNFLPSLIGALIVLVIGLIVASAFRWLVERVIAGIKLDSLLRKAGLEPYFDRAGYRMNSGKFFGFVVYWFFVVVFVLAVSDILQLFEFSFFLRGVIVYIPNIVIAILILLSAVIIGNLVRSLIRGSVLGAKLHASKFLGTLAWWAIVVFGLFASLSQLGIAAPIINTLITGFIAMLALAGGISFGLGGKDYAAHLLERLREATEED